MSHKWWLDVAPKAKEVFDELPSCDKKAVFHSLEQILNSENPCYVSGADVKPIITQPGTFRISVKDHRILYVFDGRDVTMFGHVFKGVITVTDIKRRNEGTYRR